MQLSFVDNHISFSDFEDDCPFEVKLGVVGCYF